MNPVAKPALASFWLHWILANATSFGTVWGIVSYLNASVRHYSQPLVMMFMFACLIAAPVLIGYSQQVVLSRLVVDVKYWCWILPVTFFISLVTGPFMFGMVEMTAEGVTGTLLGPNRFWVVQVLSITGHCLVYGCLASLPQTAFVCATSRSSLGWILIHSFAFAAGAMAVAVLSDHGLGMRKPYSPIGGGALIGAAGGAVYGIFSGGGLVMLFRGHDEYPVKLPDSTAGR